MGKNGRTGVKLRNKSVIGHLVLMVILSLFFVVSGVKSHTIYASDDMMYHINRIHNVVYSIKHGDWYPYLYTQNFKNVLYPLGILYPQVTLIPSAALCVVFNNYIVGIYAGFAMYTFLTMLVMFVIARKLGITGRQLWANLTC